jgi:hypothetical protein
MFEFFSQDLEFPSSLFPPPRNDFAYAEADGVDEYDWEADAVYIDCLIVE